MFVHCARFCFDCCVLQARFFPVILHKLQAFVPVLLVSFFLMNGTLYSLLFCELDLFWSCFGPTKVM
jgi:hypothetical protein